MGYIVDFILQKIKSEDPQNIQNFLCLVVGPPGSGKSYSCLSFGKKFNDKLGRKFKQEHVVFDIEAFLKLVEKDNPPGTYVLYEEMGVTVSSRNWHSILNKAMNSLLQTFRDKRLIVFFTVPSPRYVDSQSRGLFHAIFEMKSLNTKSNLAHIKPKFIQRNPSTGKEYPKYLRVREEGRIFPVRDIFIEKPPQSLIRFYEKKRAKFTSNLSADLRNQVKKEKKIRNPKKLECKICNHVWKQRNGKKPIRCPNPNCQARRWEKGYETPKKHGEKEDLKIIPGQSA